MGKAIFLDYDSTLCDFHGRWFAWLEHHYGCRFSVHDVLHYTWVAERLGPEVDRFWHTPGTYHTIKPLPGARDFVTRCQYLVGEKNVFVATMSGRGMEREKDEHIATHVGIPASQIIHSGEKFRHTAAGILVDDHPGHCLAHIDAHGIPAIIFDLNGDYGWSKPERYPHYEPEFHDRYLRRCCTYEQTLRCLERLA